MPRFIAIKFLVVFAALILNNALQAQDLCSEQGPGCRPMTAAEVKALKHRFAALKAALPVPDPARYALADGVDETYTMPFVAEVALGGALVCLPWPSGCFIEKNDIIFPYEVRAELKKSDKQQTASKDTGKSLKDMQAWVGRMQAEVGSRIEVIARLRPHPYLVDNENGKCVDVSDPEAVDIEKSATFLSWVSNEGTNLTMVFGPRTCKEADTLQGETVAPKFAPIMAIELEISGPQAEVAELKKKIDRRAFEALLGPVVK